MAIYDRIAGLPVRIEGYELEMRSLELGPEFVRVTTVIHLHGRAISPRSRERLFQVNLKQRSA